MINISVELWPFGYEVNKKVIKTIQIANDGTGTREFGSYKARFDPDDKWTEKVVEDFPRIEGVEVLLQKVLNKLLETK